MDYHELVMLMDADVTILLGCQNTLILLLYTLMMLMMRVFLPTLLSYTSKEAIKQFCF